MKVSGHSDVVGFSHEVRRTGRPSWACHPLIRSHQSVRWPPRRAAFSGSIRSAHRLAVRRFGGRVGARASKTSSRQTQARLHRVISPLDV